MWSTESVAGGLILNSTLERIGYGRLQAYCALDSLSKRRAEFTRGWYDEAMAILESRFPDLHHYRVGDGGAFKTMRANRYESASAAVVLHSVVENESNQLKQWFIANEIRLFRLHFIHLNSKEQLDFLLKHKIILKNSASAKDTFEVPWQYILPRVRTREVIVKNGIAQIGPEHFIIVASIFIMNRLLTALKIARQTVPFLRLDSRAAHLVRRLNEASQTHVKNLNRRPWTFDRANVQNLKAMASSFPPCMERMHRRMLENHRLRYHARQQYVPFLKDVGFSCDEMLAHFQHHYYQVMTPNEYRKGKYEYGIKYVYGLCGRKMEFFSLNCKQIQSNSKENTMDCHGCPLLTDSSIRTLLSSPQYDFIPSSVKEKISSLGGKMVAGEICGRILDLKTGTGDGALITDPLQYYSMHRKKLSIEYDWSDME